MYRDILRITVPHFQLKVVESGCDVMILFTFFYKLNSLVITMNPLIQTTPLNFTYWKTLRFSEWDVSIVLLHRVSTYTGITRGYFVYWFFEQTNEVSRLYILLNNFIPGTEVWLSWKVLDKQVWDLCANAQLQH